MTAWPICRGCRSSSGGDWDTRRNPEEDKFLVDVTAPTGPVAVKSTLIWKSNHQLPGSVPHRLEVFDIGP
jgi:hypothetical protein